MKERQRNGYKGSHLSYAKKMGWVHRAGSGLDTHKAIGKLPRLKAGFTPSKYKYTWVPIIPSISS